MSRLLDCLGAAGLSASVVAFAWPLFWKPNVVAEIILALALASGYFLLLRATSPSPTSEQVSLEVATSKFAEYYSSFYKREGSVYVFCRDTEWLEHTSMEPVLTALIAKGKRAALCLQTLDDDLTPILVAAGVAVVQVPDSLALEIKMSLRDNGTEKELIIRGAGAGTDSVKRSRGGDARELNTFTETRNPDIINMSLTVFRAIIGDDK